MCIWRTSSPLCPVIYSSVFLKQLKRWRQMKIGASFLGRNLACFCMWVIASAVINPTVQAQPVTLAQVVQLSLSHSPAMAVSSADAQHAYESWREARNMYIPQVILGSGLAGTYGFPLSIEGSAPSVISVGSQSFLYNPAQKQFIRAARTEWSASKLQTRDQLNQVILDAALSYRELDKWTQTREVLRA